MSPKNQETDSAVLGSPCPKAKQMQVGKSMLPGHCEQKAAGNEGQDNVHGRGLLALLYNSCGMKTP